MFAAVSFHYSMEETTFFFPGCVPLFFGSSSVLGFKSARCKATEKSLAVGCNVLTSPMVVPMCGMLQCLLLHVALG